MNLKRLLSASRLLVPFAVVLALVGIVSAQAARRDTDTRGSADAAQGQPAQTPEAQAHDMRLIGHSDVQGRGIYKGVIQKQDGRYLAYIGEYDDHNDGMHLNPQTGRVEANGVSIIDVTQPAHPKLLHHIPGTPGFATTGAAEVQTCAGADLPNGQAGKYYLLRTQRAGKDHDYAQHEMWDVSDPRDPKLMEVVQDHLTSIHKSWWDCSTGIGYLVSGVPGWHTNQMLSIFDLSDPAHPRFIRDFGLPGMQPGEDPAGRRTPQLHEPLYRDGKVYLSWGVSKNGVEQVLDADKLLKGDPSDPYNPTNPTDKQLLYPQIGRLDYPSYWGVHTSFPLLGMKLPQYSSWNNGTPRDFLFTTSEATANDCNESMQHMAFVLDITEPQYPFSVSNFQVPESKGDYCSRGGRFGTHSTNWSFAPVYYKRIVWVSDFEAGVRGVDVRDPYHPVEVAHYVPSPDKYTVPLDGQVHASTNNVEVDDRGYVYTFDQLQSGMDILLPTGHAKQIANFPAK